MIRSLLVGLSGLGLCVVPAMGGLQTVWKGGSLADPVFSLSQVVISDTGAVSAVVDQDNGVDYIPAILFNSTPGTSQTQVLVQGGSSLFGGGGAFDGFANVSMTGGAGVGGTRLTFAGSSDAGSQQFGVFQVDMATGGRTDYRGVVQGDLVFAGDANTHPYSFQPSPGQVTDLSLVSVHVNESGQSLFGGKVDNGQVLAGVDGGAATRYLDSTLGLTNFNEDGRALAQRRITSSGGAVFLADGSGGNNAIYRMSGAMQTPQAWINGPISAGGQDYTPSQVLGATDDTVLFQGVDGNNDRSIFIKHGLDPIKQVGMYGQTLVGEYAAGALTDNGLAAFLATDSQDQTELLFYDVAGNGLTQQVAAPGTAITGTPWLVQQVGIDGRAAPMLNENGVVVFGAWITEDLNDPGLPALLWWENGQLHLVAKVLDEVELDGDGGYTLTDVLSGGLGLEGDIYKDGLSDTNQLAFGVSYTGPSGDGTAVLITSVPEPTGVLWLAAGGWVLMRRRKI
jgi:hypothetical protein